MIEMMRLLTTALIFCGLFSSHTQYVKRSGSQANIRISKDKPSVYITFEKIGHLRSPDKGDETLRVWLRLRNNVRWPLRLDMGSVPSAEYGDAELFYDVVSDDDDKLIFRSIRHVFTINELGPGKTLLFSLSGEDLVEGRAIRISFSYSWENQDDVFGGREVKHYVYYYSSQLPQSVQQSLK